MNRSKRTNPIAAAGAPIENLRTLCLSLPGTSERASWGHPNFLAGKKTFVTFELVHGRPSIAFRLTHADIERLARSTEFFSTPYGRGQWISIWADTPFNWDFVRELVIRSYRLVAPKSMIAAPDAITQER
jgi:predicted DNA-binding protein (MmcQ/YjbR family)